MRSNIMDVFIKGFLVLVFTFTANLQANELQKLGEITGLPAAKAKDAAIEGDYVYITYNDSGLHVYDISDPAAPQKTAAIDDSETQEGFGHIEVSGGFAYCAAGDLYIIDVSEPSSPLITDTIKPDGYIERFSIHGDSLFACNINKGFFLYDISDPHNASLISAYYANADSSEYDYVSGIAFLKPHAFVAYEDSGVHLVDIEGGMQPAGTYYHDGLIIRDIAASKSSVYLAAYEEGMLILDVSDPSNIELAGEYNLSSNYGPEALRIMAENSTAYVLFNAWGLRVVDVSDPQSPASLDKFEPGAGYFPTGDVRSLDIDGSIAVMYDYDDEEVFIVELNSEAGVISPFTEFSGSGQYDFSSYYRKDRSSFNIDFYMPSNGTAEIDLLDVKGKFIRTIYRNNIKKGFHKTSSDCSFAQIPAGTYILRFQKDGYSIYEEKVNIIK